MHCAMQLCILSLIVNKMIQNHNDNDNDNDNNNTLFMLFENPLHIQYRQQFLSSSYA